MNGKETEIIIKESRQMVNPVNPFPGLKPFGFEESHLFFGREGQCDEILEKLTANRFVAVVGTSGSGKSSLMNCGLLPILYGGFVTEAGSNWRVYISRPGLTPLENLAESIFLDNRDKTEIRSRDLLVGKAVVSSLLQGNSSGLIDVVKNHLKTRNQNILILVDQFEEIFRATDTSKKDQALSEEIAFVNLLLKAINQREIPIYVAITMRSDFIGESAKFPELTKFINQSHYLIPQMNRQQLQLAIEGPVAVGGGKISKRLVQQLLNDIGNSHDKLPVMQHALMRTWDFWVNNREEHEPIDIRHYHAIGKIQEALSQHADETYNELSDTDKEICEVLFKSLTEKGNDNFGVRRPAKLAVIAQIARVNEQRVISIIEKFRQTGRSLLMPAPGIPLDSNTLIEISHESLMRNWTRLKNWVDEEAESAQMYLRLSEAAEMFHLGRTSLWRPPDLQLALNWQRKQKPTFIWAQRYNPLFERAMVFLETSKNSYEKEQQSKALAEKRRLTRAKITSLILGVAAIISIIFFVFAVMKKIESDENLREAVKQTEIARQNEELATLKAAEARQQQAIANRQREIAERQKLLADSATIKAMLSAEEAKIQAQIAQDKTVAAENAQKLAEENEKKAKDQQIIAERNADEAYRLRILSIAQSMAVKSLQVRDDDLKGSIAMQAYLFNQNYGGNQHDNYIYDGLYYALRQLKNDTLFYRMNAHQDAVRSMVVDRNRVFSTGSDGKIISWDLNDYKNKNKYQTIINNGFVNRVLKLSQDGRWLVNGGTMNYIQLIDLQNRAKIIKIEGHEGIIHDIHFLHNNEYFISVASDSTIRLNDFSNSRLLKKLDSQVKTIDITPDGKTVAGGSIDGKVYLWNSSNFENQIVILDQKSPVHKVSFNNAGNILAVGDETGNVTIIDLSQGFDKNKENIVLTGHHARINDIKFSNDDFYMATAGFDGRVQLWVMNDLDHLPIVLRDHDSYVWSLNFSRNGDYLLSGGKNGTIKIWPTSAHELASQFCNLVERNMSPKEWERYVAPDIKYENTCPSVNQ